MKKKDLKNNLIFSIFSFFPFVVLLIFMLASSNIYIKMFFYTCSYIFLIYMQFRKRKFNLLSMPALFTVFHAVYIGLCPLFLIIQYLFYGKESYLIKSIILSNNFINGQCVWILITYFVYVFTSMIFDMNTTYDDKKEIEFDSEKIIPYSRFICLVLIAVSFVCELVYLLKNFGVLFSGNLESGRISAMSGNGLLLYGIWLGTFGVAMLYELVLREKYSSRKFWIICVVHALTITLIGFRSRIITLMFLLVLIHNRYKKLNMKKVINIGISMLIIVSVLGIGREILSGEEGSSLVETMVSSLANGSININYIFNAFPKKVDFQHGYTFLINLKILSPGQNDDFTIWLKKAIGIEFSGGGLTPTLLGEAYINFNYVGMIVYFIIIGIIVNMMDKIYYKSYNVYFSAFYIWIITSSVRGGFSNSILNLLIFSIVNFYIWIISKCFVKKGLYR